MILRSQLVGMMASAAVALGAVGACGGDDDSGGSGTTAAGGANGSPEETASTCEAADECYPNLDVTTLSGAAVCLDRVRGGHCTHLCDTDADCCAAEGECRTNLRQVCAPFESTGQRMCFLSCEREDIEADGGELDDVAYCQEQAGRDFTCRSTGGGSDNRKVCVPVDCGVGAACANDGECGADETCLLDFAGGYCGARGCESNADCPGASVCVAGPTENLCMAPCEADVDCSLCRGTAFATACEADVELADGSLASVCRPVPR